MADHPLKSENIKSEDTTPSTEDSSPKPGTQTEHAKKEPVLIKKLHFSYSILLFLIFTTIFCIIYLHENYYKSFNLYSDIGDKLFYILCILGAILSPICIYDFYIKNLKTGIVQIFDTGILIPRKKIFFYYDDIIKITYTERGRASAPTSHLVFKNNISKYKIKSSAYAANLRVLDNKDHVVLKLCGFGNMSASQITSLVEKLSKVKRHPKYKYFSNTIHPN
tara:strand:- start:58 stop:723 length:666 start_codon:yes stop_codon:yes gene_type:complete